MANIMLSNVNGTGDLLCLFIEEEISADVVGRGFRALGISYTDAFAVRDEELQYYLYEPCWLTAEKVAKLRSLAQNTAEK